MVVMRFWWLGKWFEESYSYVKVDELVGGGIRWRGGCRWRFGFMLCVFINIILESKGLGNKRIYYYYYRVDDDMFFYF